MTAPPDDLAYTTATDLARLIRTRDLSPVELMDVTIERIERRDTGLGAFVYRGFDEARARAKAAEQAVMDGAELGPLHGIPTAMKDLFDFKPGWPSTFGGVRALAGTVIDARCAIAGSSTRSRRVCRIAMRRVAFPVSSTPPTNIARA